MPPTPRLSRKLRQTLGEEATGDLVNWMQQVDTQRAEQRDLIELNFARFDARLAEVRQETRADLAELRQETKAGLAELRQETKTGLAELRQELSRLETKLEQRFGDLIKWSFVFWVGAVGAIAALAGLLR
jgi:hypothetical protein